MHMSLRYAYDNIHVDLTSSFYHMLHICTVKVHFILLILYDVHSISVYVYMCDIYQ